MPSLYKINRDIENFAFDIAGGGNMNNDLFRWYQVNNTLKSALDNAVDEETGELKIDAETLMELQIERDELYEGLAVSCKELKYAIEAAKKENEKLEKRIKTMENNLDKMKSALQTTLNGEKFKTPNCSISYKKSQQVVLAGEFDDWAKENMPELLTVKTTYTPSKTAIKEAMLEGKNVQYATLIENTNLILK